MRGILATAAVAVWAFVLCADCAHAAQAAGANGAAGPAAPATTPHPGKAVYDRVCAACHDHPGNTRAPSFDALKGMR